jgi:transcription elongation factor S-II
MLNAENFRANVRNRFQDVIKDENKSVNLEKALYNYTIKEAGFRKIVKKWENPPFVHLYVDRLRSLFTNLNNEDILKSIRNDELKVQVYAFMTHQEMIPSHWKELLEKKALLENSKFETDLVANTDMFTCGKCKSKKCSYYTMQTRSADEPETIFISCLDCGKNWKR